LAFFDTGLSKPGLGQGSNDKIQMSTQIQNLNVKIFSKTISYLPISVTCCQVHGFPLKAGVSLTALQAASSSGGDVFFILLGIVDLPARALT